MPKYRGVGYDKYDTTSSDGSSFSQWTELETDSSDDLANMGMITLTCGRCCGFELTTPQEWSTVCLFIHMLHPIASALLYVNYISTAEDELGDAVVTWYRVAVVFSALSFFLIASVFYMWAFRYHDDERSASDRRTLGVLINLIFSDGPLFALEVHIVWKVTWTRTPWLTICLMITLISFAFSALKVWLWAIDKYLRGHERETKERPSTLPGYKRAGPVYDTQQRGDVARFERGGKPAAGWSIGDVNPDGWPADEKSPTGDLLDAEALKTAAHD